MMRRTLPGLAVGGAVVFSPNDPARLAVPGAGDLRSEVGALASTAAV